MASIYHTSRGTDTAESECILLSGCAPVALEDSRLLLMQINELDLQLKQLSQQLNQKSPIIACDPCPMPAQSCVYNILPTTAFHPWKLSHLCCQAHSSFTSLRSNLMLLIEKGSPHKHFVSCNSQPTSIR